MAHPVSQETANRVLELHEQGLGRNAIARECGVSFSVVTRVVAQAGKTFDRTATAVAVEARKVDAAAKRTELQNRLLEDALRMRRKLWQPAVVYNFGGKDNTYEERTLDEPPFADKLKIMQAVATATTTSLRLAEHDSGQQTSSVNLIIATAQALGLTEVDGE